MAKYQNKTEDMTSVRGSVGNGKYDNAKNPETAPAMLNETKPTPNFSIKVGLDNTMSGK